MGLATKMVKEWVAEIPRAAAIFERLHIDYCYGGNKTVEAACAAIGLDPAGVIEELENISSAAEAGQDDTDWKTEPLSRLISHIVGRHHSFVKEELPRLHALVAKVCAVHGSSHPELAQIQTSFKALKDELDPHLLKEEHVLFPYITAVEEAAQRNQPAAPAPFGTVQHPIRMMLLEHENAGEALRAIRVSSSNYTLPDGACFSYRALFQGLEAFESDLHQHIHLENNILFPRAVALETGAISLSHA